MRSFRPRVALALLAALSTAGCLKADGKTTIGADGAGKISQTWVVDLEMLGQMIDMYRQQFDPAAAGVDDPEAADRLVDWLKARVKGAKGVEVGAFEDAKKDGKRTVKFDAKFPDLESLAKAGLLGVTGSELTKAEDGAYTLKIGFVPPAEEMGAFDLATMRPLLEPMLGGLSFKQVVTFPGAVSETNGTKSEDGKSVTFVVTFEDLCSGKTGWNVTFKGKDLTLAPFVHKTDVMTLVQELMAATKKKPKEPKPEPAMGDAAMGDAAMGEPPAMADTPAPAMTEPSPPAPAMN